MDERVNPGLDEEEDLISCDDDEREGKLDVTKGTGLRAMAVSALCINMVMGAGVVGLPYAFFHAGAWISCVVLAFATIMAATTMGYIVEVCGWCEGFTAEEEMLAQDRCLTLDEDGAADEGKIVGRPAGPHLFKIQSRTFELTEMTGMFLGIPIKPCSWLSSFADRRGNLPLARILVEILICCNIMISCWLYVSIFGASLSIIVPQPFVQNPPDISKCLDVCTELDQAPCLKTACEWVNGTCTKSEELIVYCDSSYSLFSWIFGVVMMMIACLDLSGLSAIQGCLSMFAFTALCVMVITCAIAIRFDSGDDMGWDQLPQTDISGLAQLVTCAITSQMSHQGVPTLIGLLRNKSKAKRVFCASLTYSLSMYVLLCLSTSIFFGPSISSIVTLNWERYSGGVHAGVAVPWWASALSFMVLLFPVVSVSAAFPLQLVVLSEILLKAFGGSGGPRGSWSNAPIRIMCCFCAVCLAQVVSNVSAIIAANAAVGILIAFVLPCLLHLRARDASVKRWGSEAGRTPYYSTGTSHPIFVCFMLFCSVVIEAFSLSQLAKLYATSHKKSTCGLGSMLGS